MTSSTLDALTPGWGGGERKKACDQETMYSQLAKPSASQRFLEQAGKILTAHSPARAAQVQS